MRTALVLTVALALSACADAAGRATSPVAWDSLGIEIVEYDLSPDAPRYQLPTTPVADLASGEEFFSRTWSFDRHEDGRLLVFDNSGSARVFDVDGQLLARFSRFGDGPAELGQARFAWWNPDGGVTIYDEFRAGLLTFDSESQFAERRALPYNFGSFAARLAGGTVVIARSPLQEFALGYSRARMNTHVVRPSGDTLTWPEPVPGPAPRLTAVRPSRLLSSQAKESSGNAAGRSTLDS